MEPSPAEGGATLGVAGEPGSIQVGAAGQSPGAGFAGAGDAGGAPSRDDCDVQVPRDFAFIDEAVAAVTPPATICLDVGVYGAKAGGPIYLRGGVVIRGDNRADSVLCGDIDVSAAQDEGVTLEDVGIAGVVRGQTAVKLALRRVAANHEVVACAADVTRPAIDLHVADPTRTLELDVEQTLFWGPGVLLTSYSPDVAVRANVSIRRSACFWHQCWDFARFELGSLTADSEVHIRIENNIVSRSVLEAIALNGHFPAAASAASSISIVNNTIYSPSDLNYGILLADDLGASVLVANNAIGNLARPIVGPAASFNNVTASEGAEAWFLDGEADFAPAQDSPLRDQAAAEYLPAIDYDGKPRTSNDVGALGYR
jgi:hypothetical protein